MASKVENVAEMICIAHGKSLNDIQPQEKERVFTWAESIVQYLRVDIQ